MVTLGSPVLHAQMPPQKEVRLVVAADEQEARAIELVARELLARLNVSVSVMRVESLAASDIAAAKVDPRYVAEVWVDLAQAERASLFILDTTTDRMLVRVLPRTEGEAEITREALGHILETSTEGLLSGTEMGAPRAEVLGSLETSKPEPAPTASPPYPSPSLPKPVNPTARRDDWFQVGAFYEVTRFAGGGHIAHGPVGSLSARILGVRLHPGAWFTAQYRLPMQVLSQPVDARIMGGAFRLLGTLDGALSERISLGLGLGGGVDLAAAKPETSNASQFTLAKPHLLRLPVVRGAVTVKWQVTPFTIVGAGFVLDADLSNTRFVVARTSGDVEVLAPSRFRPGVLFGVEVP
jgi:hypothetical protein